MDRPSDIGVPCYHERVRWLVFAILACFAATALAGAPQVDIKARTRLVLEKVRLKPDGEVEITGQLLDKLTGDGIGNQTVTVKVSGETVTARTGPDGRFTAGVIANPGTQDVQIEFHGGPQLDRADQLKITTDPSRSPVTLGIQSEPASGGTKLVITASADDRPTTLTATLDVLGAGSEQPALHKNIDSGTAFLLTRAAAGGPGQKRVRASFAGDSSRQPAQAEITLELTSATTTTMQVAKTSLAYEDNIRVTGKVVDEDGKAVPRAAVALMANVPSGEKKRLASGATAEDGSYSFKVEAEILGQGQFAIGVETDPGSPAVRPSHAEPAIIRIAAPQPVPVSYTLVAFMATAIAAGGFFLARSKPWQRLRRPAPPAEAPQRENAEQVDGGLVLNKPGIVSTLRRPYDDGFSGVVRDTVRGRPVEGAVVRLIHGANERELRTAADGSFSHEQLAVGDWRAEVAAPGHITERFVVSIPHRGELRGVRIDLVPVRERVFQLYRRAAEPVLPESRLWGIWSPRQIVDHVRAKRPSPALADLTDFVEEIYFSPRLAGESVLPHASERVDRAIRERARV